MQSQSSPRRSYVSTYRLYARPVCSTCEPRRRRCAVHVHRTWSIVRAGAAWLRKFSTYRSCAHTSPVAPSRYEKEGERIGSSSSHDPFRNASMNWRLSFISTSVSSIASPPTYVASGIRTEAARSEARALAGSGQLATKEAVGNCAGGVGATAEATSGARLNVRVAEARCEPVVDEPIVWAALGARAGHGRGGRSLQRECYHRTVARIAKSLGSPKSSITSSPGSTER